MNKTLVGITLAVAVIGLVGCGTKSTEPTETGLTDTETQKAESVVQLGDTVKVDYVGTLEDGTMFDTSLVEKAKDGDVFDEARPYEPLTVNVGKGEVIPGFENGLVGMKVDETKKITLSADEAYGQPREELIQKVPVDTFSGSEIVPEVGKTYNFGIAQGTIKEISPTEITIDFNHPLAGKTLIFEITVKEIIPGGAGAIAPAPMPMEEMPIEEPMPTEEEAVMPEEEVPATE